MKNKRKLAIIGIGPRGGYALENLVKELSKEEGFYDIHLLLFEETGNWGNGQVYDTKQIETNWININERILELDVREEISFRGNIIPRFPSYHEWRTKDFNSICKLEADTYPPRAIVGQYLEQRFQTLVKVLLREEIVSLIEERVEKVTLDEQNKIVLTSNKKTYKDIDEILLTIGHQSTKTSGQISEWDKFSNDKKDLRLFKNAYPISQFLNSNNLTDKSRIGVRGFGLAMIDVVRGIASEFGTFKITDERTKACEYQTKQEINKMFIPFSLDGLPPVPKPLNAKIDEWFKPTDEQLSLFEQQIGDKSIQKKANSYSFLIKAFAPIAAEVYLRLPRTKTISTLLLKDVEQVVQEWLQNQKYQDPRITSLKHSPEKMMRDFIKMAAGKGEISLDYCIGQVWRYCQPSIYKQLSYNECSNNVFAKIIELDESTKRYSYGPPVESIQQMLALTEADVMTLDFVKNPDFDLKEKAWLFQTEKEAIAADMMINSVLDAPKIKAVDAPIVKSILSQDLVEAVHDDLGVLTDESGYIISENKEFHVPIAMLGRLAKGTIIGVDAILECFGSRSQKWASKAARRHLNHLTFDKEAKYMSS